jgi:hypothetical protein
MTTAASLGGSLTITLPEPWRAPATPGLTPFSESPQLGHRAQPDAVAATGLGLVTDPAGRDFRSYGPAAAVPH